MTLVATFAFGRAQIARGAGRAVPVLAGAAVLSVAASASPAAERGDEQARIAAVTQPAQDFSRAEAYERRPAGAATVFKPLNRDSFSHPSANMSFKRERDFHVGNGIFRKIWVSSPSSTTSSDGLGPLFNARACQPTVSHQAANGARPRSGASGSRRR